ncbi:MAG: hypothetical protein K2K27_02110 [Muribaculaceae bacterium]|nr:hypothetical protein [Muribaculaceae bacterium]
MESEKKQCGGARANAGRKKLENARNISVACKLSQKTLDYLGKTTTDNNQKRYNKYIVRKNGR